MKHKLIQKIGCFLIVFNLVPLWSSKTHAQSVDIKSVEIVENKILIHFDLSDSVQGRSYSVRLYSSSDGFLNPQEKISGDVGLEIKPGANKLIIWDAQRELGDDFTGKISLEIRGRLFIPFINTEGINGYKVFKRKRKYELSWSGGSVQNILNFDLYKGEKKIISFPNIGNVGHHTFEFPGYIRPGKGYKFRISDSKNKEDVVNTSDFRIKRKFPLIAKAIPTLAACYGIFMVFQKPSVDQGIGEPILPK